MPLWLDILIGAILTALVTGLGYILARLDRSISQLNDTTTEQSKVLEKFRTRTEDELQRVGESALRAERQGKENELQLADHETRIVKIETEHKIFHVKQ